jgi:hypothetical protein
VCSGGRGCGNSGQALKFWDMPWSTTTRNPAHSDRRAPSGEFPPVRGERGEYQSLLSNEAAKEKLGWSPRHSRRDHVPS